MCSNWTWSAFFRKLFTGSAKKHRFTFRPCQLHLERSEERSAPGNILGGLAGAVWANQTSEAVERVAALVGDMALLGAPSQPLLFPSSSSRLETSPTAQGLFAEIAPTRILPEEPSAKSSAIQPVRLEPSTQSQAVTFDSETFRASWDSMAAETRSTRESASTSGGRGSESASSGGGEAPQREESPKTTVPPPSSTGIKTEPSETPLVAARPVNANEEFAPLSENDFQADVTDESTLESPDPDAFMTFSELTVNARTVFAYPDSTPPVALTDTRTTSDEFVDTNATVWVQTTKLNYSFAITRSLDETGAWNFAESYSCTFEVAVQAKNAPQPVYHSSGTSAYTLTATGSGLGSSFTLLASHNETTQELWTETSTQDGVTNQLSTASERQAVFNRSIAATTDFTTAAVQGFDNVNSSLTTTQSSQNDYSRPSVEATVGLVTGSESSVQTSAG